MKDSPRDGQEQQACVLRGGLCADAQWHKRHDRQLHEQHHTCGHHEAMTTLCAGGERAARKKSTETQRHERPERKHHDGQRCGECEHSRDLLEGVAPFGAPHPIHEQPPAQPPKRPQLANHPASHSIVGVADRSAPTRSRNISSSVLPTPAPDRSSLIGPCATSRPFWITPM